MKMSFSHNQGRLLRILENQARRLLNSFSEEDSYTYKVTQLVFDQLEGRRLGIDVVADHLSMSVRSLQMKLKDEGTSYQKLLNSVREYLAVSFLKEHHISKGEISELLGFSEISVFSRTFKKWTGQSPSEFQLQFS